jgi:cell wall-associated NlpC family hydrolase
MVPKALPSAVDDLIKMRIKALNANRLERLRRLCLTGLLILAIAGCAGAASGPALPAGADSAAGKTPNYSTPHIAAPAATASDHSGVEQRLRSEVRQWRGTPHRMGGESRRGIDCSGFVQRLYRDIFDRRIPRSTALQVKSGRPVGSGPLRVGDLVFFKVPGKGRHVGIYLGGSEFAHASTSKGVMISNLEDRFWGQAYWTARRYLNTPD